MVQHAGWVLLHVGGNMTDKEAKKFYDSGAWQEKRIRILIRDHYECQDCRERLRAAVESGTQLNFKERIIRRATEVHHIKELKEHPELALDDDNLISLCYLCHNKRHGRYQGGRTKKKEPLTEEKW